MSSGTTPPKGPNKPFLGDDDLNSELDAWDATFDALHDVPLAGAEPGATQVMGWPVPTEAPAAAPVEVAPPLATLSGFDPVLDAELEEQLTLDRAEPNAAERTLDQQTFEPPAGETDFSDVGADRPPAALGGLLGRHGTAPPAVDQDTRLVPIEPPRSGRSTLPPDAMRDDEDEVFTSASRPRLAAPPDQGLDDDALAPPPIARPAPEPRRGPAIVRRTPLPVPVVREAAHPTPARGIDVSEFAAEPTKIQDIDEVRARAHQSRSSHATLPPPIVEDDYADIEIDASSDDDAAPTSTPAPSIEPLVDAATVGRRTAHVVRRGDAPTRPPPVQPASTDDDDEIAVELDVDEPVATAPASEDDFSDVAAAVGVRHDDPLEGLEALASLQSRRPPSPLLLEPVAQVEPDEPLRSLPTLIDTPRKLADLYPRVKTPTSFPPLAATGAGIDRTSIPQPGAPPSRLPRLPTPAPVELDPPRELEPELDLDAASRTWPEQVDPLSTATLDEACAQALQVYERELATVDDDAAAAALRVEAGRLCERLTDGERARSHYDAALLADPRATAALRGLRRLARASGDLVEATRQLDAEIAVAGALERRPLGHYRIDLLMASGEQDLARVAVGELLDSAPSDVRALLAHLELAFLDGRAEEFGAALEQLAHAVTDPELRAAVQSARGALAAHHNDSAAAASWFGAAAESDPTALAARIGAVRHAAAQADGGAASRALVDLARGIEGTDPVTAAAVAVRAQQWAGGDVGATAAAIATALAPSDPLVARLAAETAAAAGAPAAMSAAFLHWSTIASSDAERAYASARAAELDPALGIEQWSAALALDPGDDYAAAQLRTAHVAANATQAAIDVDLGVSQDVERDRARLRAAYGLIALGQLDGAIDVLERGRAGRPESLAIAEALGEALAAGGRWTARAKLFAELAADPGEQLDREVAQLRSAIAWEEAVGAAAAAASSDPAQDAELQRATAAALEAWERVLEHHAQAPTAHAAAIVLASRLGDREVIAEVLSRAQTAERSPWVITSLALRRARLFATEDGARADAILAELPVGPDDPRRTTVAMIAAARAGALGEAAAALEQRANLLDGKLAATEIATLRLRAAQLALDAGDAPRATGLLERVEAALPQLGVVSDLLAAARRRAGDRGGSGAIVRRGDAPVRPSTAASAGEAYVRLLRDADLAAARGDQGSALALYQRALELRPGDPIAALPLIRTANLLREPAPAASLALAHLRAAEEAADGVAKAVAYEQLAQIDSELRDDAGSAQIALESAASSDPSRIDLMHRLERNYAANEQLAELIRLRRLEIEVTGVEFVRDRTALLVDLAGIATRDQRPELEVADMYRAVLQTDPTVRLALMHLETIVRRAGMSEELAQLEERIAGYFEGDPRSQAAFWTRAGETLAEIGRIDEAVVRFGRAEATLPGHVPALEGWRQAALKGQLWIDVADAATRQAGSASTELSGQQRGALHHFAGVALMDKALVGEQAMVAFRHALDADPGHKDAFLRLRILLEEDANHDDLATLLAQRLDVEQAGAAKLELHRALAELHRNFLSDRETAKEHYRHILDSDPNDLRAHAAVADIAWEQGNWQEAADALMSRARLEREPDILKTLCFRLGLIYADRLVDVPMALKAFQRALSYQPDDENTLVRLADLATQAGEWKLALGACERLVKNEPDADRRAAHLQRVARIFKDGFGDARRAERALNLALDGAPTNDEALTQLVQFYRDANDMTSVRVHLNRVAGAMRARVAQQPQDGIAYRVISRAMSARAAAGVDGSRPIARAAAELAELLSVAGEPEQRLLADPIQPDLAPLLRPDADDVLFPRTVQIELRQVFQLLGDRIAKHVGVDLRPYGATRGDRLRARDNPVAAVAQTVASGLGFGEIDVYLSSRQPWAMVAEPTSPISLVIGQAIASSGGDAIRFAAGAALKLAQASLAIPARLAADDLGVLVVALLRLFQPEFPLHAVDGDAVGAQTQKLRRLIPTSLLNELRPFALAISPTEFSHEALARDLKIAGLRAGLVASGSLLAGLRTLAAQAEVADVASFLADPVAQGLISFALGEDHAIVAR